MTGTLIISEFPWGKKLVAVIQPKLCHYDLKAKITSFSSKSKNKVKYHI
jgi:hypothetical protein